jgi:hypothetical protein
MSVAGLVALSMIAHLKMISPAQVAELHKHPSQVARMISAEIVPLPSHPKTYADVRPSLLETTRFGAREMGIYDVELAIAMAKQNAPQFAKEIDADRDAYTQAAMAPADELGLGKAWHGIHFLLSGKAEGGRGPWSDAIMGGTAVGGDMGYGPARILSPAQVAKVAAALQTLAPAAFKKRFDARKLDAAEIYPNDWEDSGAEMLEQSYAELRDFYRRAAAQKSAVIIWLD